MELYFICPRKGVLFASDGYRLGENHGVREKADGGRVLQGEVALTTLCPHCGEKHIYRVDEVICPSGR